jgi:hypothetical protein
MSIAKSLKLLFAMLSESPFLTALMALSTRHCSAQNVRFQNCLSTSLSSLGLDSNYISSRYFSQFGCSQWKVAGVSIVQVWRTEILRAWPVFSVASSYIAAHGWVSWHHYWLLHRVWNTEVNQFRFHWRGWLFNIWRLLTVVYSPQNHWACELCPSSGILNS